ncbi:LysR family transcriptional regulator [Paraburkholderia sp. Ac-20340]|uniref:LysR family transcriptional regulator n=1 Tax=Paraburkholderia sp. Ac-20340 TaxID=2703888 RepID=UPI001981DCE5|nr:LysR family transcriptional regulator [Paraburkholderia sp. Ac-20340]MBN3854060.1 LysR family transcriptional regulator [Paraburkholderia sp. Ac-20340]
MLRAGFSELNAFVAVAASGSFSAAARTLEVSPSALSHAMKGLEARLGVRLLNRTTRAVSLTEAGERLLARVRTALSDLEEALEETASSRARPSGSIRINAPESGAKLLLLNVLPDFLEKYPDIHVEFVIDSRLVDVVSEGFDAGIRVHEDVPRDMIAVRFGPDIRLAAVASPEYIGKFGKPEKPADLLKHRCIRFRFESGKIYRWDLRKGSRETSIDVQGPMTLGNINMMVEAALAGIGVAWVPEHSITEHLASGRLLDLLPKWSPSFAGLCLYYPANRHPPTALRLFSEAIREWASTQELSR